MFFLMHIRSRIKKNINIVFLQIFKFENFFYLDILQNGR